MKRVGKELMLRLLFEILTFFSISKLGRMKERERQRERRKTKERGRRRRRIRRKIMRERVGKELEWI